jgi:hypothetical protein
VVEGQWTAQRFAPSHECNDDTKIIKITYQPS